MRRIASHAEYEARLWSRVDIDPANGCWVYRGTKHSFGYGQMWFQGKLWYTHRLAFMFSRRAYVLGDVEIMHTCDNPPCCNPGHLRAGNRQLNTNDMMRKGRGSNGQVGKTRCLHGHPYNEENTYVDKVGWRQCRTCNRLRERERRVHATK